MSKSHVFSIDDAIEHGVEKAVILQNLRFWLDKVKANNKDTHKHDGFYWTYNSARAFAELFPYFTERKIQRLLTQLEEDGIIMSGNYNKMAYDRTKWYSMPEFSISQNCQMEVQEVSNGNVRSVEPIPDVITDVIPDVNPNIITDSKKPSKKRKHDMPDDFSATEKQIEKCNEYGINVNELISDFDDYHSSKGNQYVDWSKAFNTWINRHIKFNKIRPVNQLTVNNQGYSHAQSQHRSPAEEFAAKLEQQLAADEGGHNERTVN